METNQIWYSALNAQNELCEYEDRQGKAFIATFTQVVQYAKAFRDSSYPTIHFYYFHLELNRWFLVTFTRDTTLIVISVMCCDLPFELSDRELEIVSLVSNGLSNAEIAEVLHISSRTVAKHIEHIFEKTGIDNRTVLAVFAVQHHLCVLPAPKNITSTVIPAFVIAQNAENHTEQAVEKPVFFVKQSRSMKPITIGIPFVEEGIGKIDTPALLNGAQLAVNEINRQGGILGREVQIIKAGYQVEDQKSILNAYQTLFDQEVEAICSNYACYLPEVHEMVSIEGIPYLHDASHSGSDKSGKIGNIFQVCASSINYGLGVVRFLTAYHANFPQFTKGRKIVIVTVKWQQIDIGMDTLIASLRKLNWQVEVIELEKSPQVFAQAMRQIHQIDPSLIVFVSYFTEDILGFYAEFIREPLNAIIYAIYAPSTLQPHQQLCEGVLWATTTGLPSTYAGRQFNQLYQQTFGEAPSFSQASLAFDQVNILANVWQRCDYPRHFSQVNKGIRSLVKQGINGAYFFGNDHQIGLTYPDSTDDLSISQPHLLYQIQQGRNTVIAPSLFAESAFQLPKWFSLKE